MINWKSLIVYYPNILLSAGITAASLFVLILDIHTPVEYAVWLLYVFPLIFSYWLPTNRIYYFIPIMLTFFNIAGFYLDPKQTFTQFEIFNRSLGIAIIWITEILVRLHKQSDIQLRQNILNLNTSNRELEQFAYVASHDLREPLRTVNSFAELLSRRFRETLGIEGNQFIQHILNGAAQMQKLIESLLELARVGHSQANAKWVDCSAIVNRVTEGLNRLILDEQATVTVGILPKLFAQEDLLVQLFHNLIHNAIKFHGLRKPQVNIRAVPLQSDWCFSVQDNGIGIAPEYFERVFMLFQRLHNPNTYSGSGIGLAICKKIVEMHGGEIWIESVPGQGSTFYFTLKSLEGGFHE